MKKGMIVAVAAGVVLLAAGVFALCQREPTAADWAQNLQKQKAAPYQTGLFTPPGGDAVALKYRVFKPASDITKIPGEPPNWRKDPVDSFLRQCYGDLLDPNPTFAKYAESFADGMNSIEETLTKFPELRDDPQAFFKKFRGDYSERKFVGEIVVNDVHLLVYVYVNKEGGVLKIGSPFVKTTEGSFLAFHDAWEKIPVLDALARDQYGIVCNHFPEYGRKNWNWR